MRWILIFLLMCGPVGLREGESFLSLLVSLRKSKKRLGGVCSLHGQPNVGLWVCQHV